jgi:hypothetical protein
VPADSPPGEVHRDLEARPRRPEAPRHRQRLEVGLVEGEDGCVGEGVEVELRRVEQRHGGCLDREASEPDFAVAELCCSVAARELQTQLPHRESHERLGIHGDLFNLSLGTGSRHFFFLLSLKILGMRNAVRFVNVRLQLQERKIALHDDLNLLNKLR